MQVKASTRLVCFLREIEESESMPLSVLNIREAQEEVSVSMSVIDIKWVQEQLQHNRRIPQIHLHHLLEGCELVLPVPSVEPRSLELDERCHKLRQEQENRDYRQMTKNVDASRKAERDTHINYEMREVNAQLVAVLQVILSIVGSFVFGYFSIEVIMGTKDFVRQLSVGFSIATIVMIAEAYFLVKQIID